MYQFQYISEVFGTDFLTVNGVTYPKRFQWFAINTQIIYFHSEILQGNKKFKLAL